MSNKYELPLDIVDHDPRWSEMFEIKKQKLQTKIKTPFIRIEHIGSTAIPDAKAKPIIDMLAVVESFEEIHKTQKQLEKYGFTLENNKSNDYYYFIKLGNKMAYSLTVMEQSNDKGINNLLMFKDFLIKHPNAQIKYDFLKCVAQVEYPDDIDRYAQVKDEFVNEIKRKL